ncbi:MAG: DNA adenine methylase [Pseudomonadota bacterium]
MAALSTHSLVSQKHESEDTLVRIVPVQDLIRQFPATRYYGSKKKLLPWMFDNLKSLDFQTVLDAFGGTASVSLLFRAMRKEVTFHDSFQFNVDVAQTLLSNLPLPDRREVEDTLAVISQCEGLITRKFANVFFKAEENQWLDGFMRHMRDADVSEEIGAMYRYLLYQACLKKRPYNLFHRANLSLRTNTQVKRSFGNLATWEKSFTDHMLEAYDELAHMDAALGPAAKILEPGDAADIKSGYDLVYLDPPYVSERSSVNLDNYWRRYHFLEGLASYEAWEEKIQDQSKTKEMVQPAHFRNWSRASSFKEQLFELIEAHKSSIVALSYVTNAFPTQEEITAEFERHFNQVSVHSTQHNHALSRTKKRELLFIGLPK